jgi:hypothetical protein
VKQRRINWNLIERYALKPHQHLNISCGETLICENGHDHQPGTGEVLQEARVVQHLCDLAGVPEGHGYSANIDARVFQLMLEAGELQDRLDRLAAWHARETEPGGMVGDYCIECDALWPCESRMMADGTHPDLATESTVTAAGSKEPR